jgi:hypothetical protein
MENVKQPLAAAKAMQKIPTQMCDYVFSPKVDGLRLLLTFFHDRNNRKICNFINRKNEVFSLPSSSIFPESIFSGTMLDGDLVRIPDTNKFCFVIFDCLLSCGNKSSVLRYDQRLEIGREIIFRLGTNDLSTPITQSNSFTPVNIGAGSKYALPIALRPEVSKGMFIPGHLPFFIAVKPIVSLGGISDFNKNHENRFYFPIDGYIFTKLSDPAYPFRMKRDSIYKWKQKSKDGKFNDNTIDVIISKNTNNYDQHAELMKGLEIDTYELPNLSMISSSIHDDLHKFRSKNGELLMFAIDNNNRPILFSHAFEKEDLKIHDGGTYECRWNYQQSQWDVFRFRDKAPNTISTIISCVTNILEDISIDELLI